MSLLIKGMKMPENCKKCRCSWYDFTRLYCEADGKPWGLEVTEYADRRHPNCPLIEVPEWIPVTERLPDSDTEYVLCCGSKGGMFVGWAAIKTYDGSGKCTGFQNSGKGRNFTHWMPLPEPPKDGDNNG